jgi:hypothetical protein
MLAPPLPGPHIAQIQQQLLEMRAIQDKSGRQTFMSVLLGEWRGPK